MFPLIFDDFGRKTIVFKILSKISLRQNKHSGVFAYNKFLDTKIFCFSWKALVMINGRAWGVLIV